ncbi:MAG: hypothetical protein ABEH43_05045, partial [Flavobacteriales bacterium]
MKRLLFFSSIMCILSIYSCKNSEETISQKTTKNESETKEEDTSEQVREKKLKEVKTTTQVDTPKQKVYKGSEKRIFDLTHTRLKVKFNWKKERVKGTALLTFTPHFYPIDSAVIDAQNFNLHKIALNSKEGPELNYDYDNKKIHIDLNKKYTRKDTFKIFIDYTAKPTERETEGSSAISSDQGIYFIDL